MMKRNSAVAVSAGDSVSPRFMQRERGGTILSMLLGLFLGLLVTLCIAWYLLKAASFHSADAAAAVENVQSERQVRGERDARSAGGGYNFYEMLEKGKNPPVSPAEKGNGTFATAFYLLAGDFEKPVEADTMRALLALNGIDASVQRVRDDDDRVVHRVRIGPFETEENMAAVRSRLTEAGVGFMSASQPR